LISSPGCSTTPAQVTLARWCCSASPGVGKSALLEEAVGRSQGFQLLRTQGLESEAPLAFAALHRLLTPVQDLVATCPSRRPERLRVALGLDSGPAVEPFLVAVATLSILRGCRERTGAVHRR
jgi:hypothetical protein